MTGKPSLLVLLEPCVTETDYESKMVPLMRKHLDRKSFPIFVLCSSTGYKALEGECEKYYTVKHRFNSSAEVIFWTEYSWYLFSSFFRLVAVARATKARVLISLSGHAYSGLVVSLAARMLHRKSIVRISEPTRFVTRGRYRFSSLVSTLVSIAESLTFRFCSVVISNRDMSWYHSKVRSKQRILSQGVDLDLFVSDAVPAFYSDAFPKLITVSRLDRQKNIESVIKAVKLLLDRYPMIVYHIVGIGKDEKRLRELAETYGLCSNVVYHGSVKPERIPSLLRSCDIFALPSLVEGLPSAVLEAMACGVPVVLGCTRYDYDNWFVNEENVILVRGDPETVAQAVIRIVSDNGLREKLVFNALEYVRKHHNSSDTKARFTEIIRELF